MAWVWVNTAASGAKALVALILELQNAVKQLSADIYTTPVNAGDGSAELSTPLQSQISGTSLAMKAGTYISGGKAGVTVSFGTPFADTNYHVSITWADEPGGDIGDFWVGKGTTGFRLYTVGEDTQVFSWSAVPYQND